VTRFGRPVACLGPDVGNRLVRVEVHLPAVVGVAERPQTSEHSDDETFPGLLILRNGGTLLWLAALNPAALDVVHRAALGQLLGRERMFFNVHRAVETYLARRAPAGD
jgi:hypothetical protein